MTRSSACGLRYAACAISSEGSPPLIPPKGEMKSSNDLKDLDAVTPALRL
jgi:hypothetical protein